jgi:hypothetical protein
LQRNRVTVLVGQGEIGSFLVCHSHLSIP